MAVLLEVGFATVVTPVEANSSPMMSELAYSLPRQTLLVSREIPGYAQYSVY